MASGTIPFSPAVSGAASVEFFLNSQNFPTIRFTLLDGISYQYVMWSNNRLILQKTENGVTSTICTWTGS